MDSDRCFGPPRHLGVQFCSFLWEHYGAKCWARPERSSRAGALSVPNVVHVYRHGLAELILLDRELRVMRFLQNSILICGVILIWWVNNSPGLIYKGLMHAIGPEVVTVYEPSSLGGDPTIPVVHVGDPNTDTGQRVVVYIRNDYRDDEIQSAPRRTLKLLGFLVVIYSLVSLVGALVRRRAAQPLPHV